MEDKPGHCLHVVSFQRLWLSTDCMLHVILFSIGMINRLAVSFFTATFKQVAKTVTDVNLQDNVVNVVYKMFDENG